MYDLISKFKQAFHIDPSSVNPNNFEEERKINLLNLLLEVEIGTSVVVGGMLLFLIVLVVAWKFNFINYFSADKFKDLAQADQSSVVYTPKAELSDVKTVSLYINQQPIPLDKAFSVKPNNIKLTVTGQLKKEVFGFLPYWAIDQLDQINTRLLTTIAYFGLEVGGDGNVVVTNQQNGLDESWKDLNDPRMATFLKKAQRNRIKVLLTLKCFDNGDIQKLVTTPTAADNFINNALYLVSSKNFDGINLDFEYVGTPDQETINGFSLLVSNLNKELKREYPNSILTVSTFVTAASSTTIDDVPILAANSDALVIMGYDFTTPNSANAGAVAPMDGNGFSLTAALNSYLEKADSKKLILGVPYYGYDWPVSSDGENAPVLGDASSVKVYTYADILALSRNKSIQWDNNSLTPWFSYRDSQTGGLRVVHFENTRSLGIKYDYINQKDLKGVGIWALGFDGNSTDLTQLIADKFANE